jgi:HlyD family secretion protein
MDIQRPSQAKAKLKKRIIWGSIGVVALIGFTVFLARLKPAVPTVDKSLVWIGTVKRGPMVRQVHGPGTLVPVDIRWIASRTLGRVDKIVLLPGAIVDADSVVMVLSNPDVTQAALDTESALRSDEADYANLKVTVQSAVLQAESEAATAKASFENANLTAQVDEQLFKEGLISELNLKLQKVTAEQDEAVYNIAEKRYQFAKDSVAPQLAVKEATVDQARAQAKLKLAEADALNVRAGMHGILQVVPVEVGAQVTPGTNLARVADPTKLKAAIEIAETQAKDVQIGQASEIDTRNGVVVGKVMRVAPSVVNGTVTVDVALTGNLPTGARPDLSVDGVVELEHLDDVVFVGRPAFGQEHSTSGIFLLEADGVYANRTQVELGRSSVNTIEIVKGLNPGDQVILSDMSQWDSHDRIKLN